MRAVNARLDISRVSVFHAVGTRRGVHRARGSLCALLRATGLILEISFWPAARSARGRGEQASWRELLVFFQLFKLYTSNALSSL